MEARWTSPFISPLLLHVIILISSLFSLSNAVVPSYFNIAVLVSVDESTLSYSSRFLPAILMAIDDINNKTNKVFDSLLPESELRAIVRLSSDEFFDGGVNARQVISVDSQGVKAALGPPSFANLKGAAPVLEQFGGIPLFSYGDRTSIFGNSELYPNVFRTIPSDYYDGYVLASVVGQFFRWKKVSVFSTNTDLGRGSALLFRHYAAEYGIKILSSHSLDASQEDYTSDISRAKHLGARIIVLFVEGPVAVRLMIQGSQVHFRNTLQILSGERLSYQHWAENGMTVQDFGFLTGYIGVKLRYYAPTSALKTHFLNKWKSQTDIISNNSSFSLNCDLTRDFYNQSYLYRYDPQPSAAAAAASGANSTSSICTGVQFSSYSQDVSLLDTLNDVMYAYDAVLAIAHGLHGLIYQQNTHNPSPTELYSYLLSDVSFTGLTGQVSFSTELKSDDFNVGGRETAVVYDLFNFVPNHTSSNPEDSFPVITTWHSETGIPKCHNVSYFVDGNPCYRIHFNTDKYTITNDSPDPIKRNTLPVYFSVILKIISLLGIAFVIICIVITVIYRKRRLVKMSQPLLTYLTLFGMSLAFVSVYLSAIELTDSSCVALLWLQQLAFQIIFGTVLIRAWRVYQITAALQKKRITDRTCSLYLLLRISPTLLLLFFVTLDQSIQKHFVSVIHTQYEYILEPCCDYNNTATLGMIMYLYDTVTILIGLKWCWNIRKVRSTICNTPSLVESLVTTILAIATTLLVLSLLSLNPLVQQFFIGMIISVLMLRLLWLFESERMFHVLSGYELDQGLVLHHSERSFMDSLLLRARRVSSIAVQSSDTESPSHQKYAATNRSKEELDREIRRLQEDIRSKQEELAYVENLIFVVAETSSHAQPQTPVAAAAVVAALGIVDQ